MNHRTMRRSSQSGFTLVEIAIVLLIVGLMIGGMVAPLTAQLEQKKVSDTKRAMDDASEALFGYALRNGYLPCPAISPSNGLEDRTGNLCNKRYGLLPWATLGLTRLDGWNHLLGYTVTPAFADSRLPFSLKTPRDITIATRDAVALLHNMDNSRQIVAICEEIDRLESDADHVMRAAMSKLFRDEPDVRNLIKMKAIYEILETVTDRCEDVANIIEGIIVENA
jgi:prepilin-type N-terminal cleavage/methylation domain-containing protein